MVVGEVVRVTDQLRDRYDVVVVGGGAAGLSGALMLARARRSVVVIDAGAPRNAPAAGVHGFLSRDGIRPAELLERGRDVVHCPYCHGWEIRDQAIGVLASGPLAVHQALLFAQWSADVTLFSHTMPSPTDEEAEQLAACGIGVVDGEVASLEIVDDRLTGVRLRD